jgi:hypothetical protein
MAMKAGYEWHGTINLTTIAYTWPFLCLSPYALLWIEDETSLRVARFLTLVTALFIVGAIAVAPHAGGAQFSARFLLPVAAPAAIAMATVVFARRDLRHARFVRAFATVVFAGSVAMQIGGLHHLKRFKRSNYNIMRTTEQLVMPDDVLVSDAFWFPQITAALYPSHHLLFAPSPDDVGRIAAEASRKGFRRLAVITSTPQTGYVPAELPLSDDLVIPKRAEQYLGIASLWIHWYDLDVR